MGLLDSIFSAISPAASIDGNTFVLAAQKYGLPTDMDSMNRIVNLVNAGMDVESAAKSLAQKTVTQTSPKEGGLNASNYNNPYGLRAYPLPNGGYGGEMMPKSTGWLGMLKGTDKNKGQTMTEYSTGDNRGDFPSIIPELTSDELNKILSSGVITPQAYIKAQQRANALRSQGLSPFYNEVSAGNR